MSSRSRTSVLVILLLLALLALFWFARCQPVTPPEPIRAAARPAVVPVPADAAPSPPVTASPAADERLTAATVTFSPEVPAGAAFRVGWTGPDNPGDFVTVVRPDAGPGAFGSYRETREGAALDLTAPDEAGAWEVRYVTGRSRSVLARAALTVKPVAAELSVPGEVVAGAAFTVQWRGPNHAGDYVTVVPRGTPDGQYRSYAETTRGATLTLTAPIDTGEAEVRYVTGGQARVLARQPVRVVAAAVTLTAPVEVVAGSPVAVTWTGPGNSGDYVTIVPKATRDGQYGNYTDVAKGSPLKVTAPIEPGAAEVRYMSGQGARVLARREILLVPAKITLRPPAAGSAGTTVSIEWIGPNHSGDYLTVVPAGARDGAMFRMTSTASGSPAKIAVPKEPGPAEVRYMSGQGNRVLARAPLTLQ
ncbi:MAG: hypothetical protein JNL92_00140 [Opitutaceae bacterium]|nr:hypothetical protein [Opitutaceae bacterium]